MRDFDMNFYRQQLAKWGEWWRGDFPSWEEAEEECIGYDLDHIASKVFETVNRIVKVPGYYERDGVVIQGFPIHIMNYIYELQNKHVLDFGGSLGTVFFPATEIISVKSWNIVELPSFVKYGKQIETDILKFYTNIDDVPDVDIVLFSSSLPYIKNYLDYLYKVFKREIPTIIFDRQSVLHKSNIDRITIEVVPECIYPTIYPCWFFGENKQMRFMEDNGYKLVRDFITLGDTSATGPYVENSIYKGYVYKREG